MVEFLHLLNGGPALLVLCGFLFIEEAGIPIPVPGDAVLMSAGYLAAIHSTQLALFLPLGYLSAVAGAALCYGLSRKIGRAVVIRWGQRVRITSARLARAERWMNRAGARTVVVARLLPGTRINASIAAGCLRLSFRRFFGSVLFSTMLWVGGFTVLGYLLGDKVTPLLPWMDRIMVGLVSGLVVVGLLHWAQRFGQAKATVSLDS